MLHMGETPIVVRSVGAILACLAAAVQAAPPQGPPAAAVPPPESAAIAAQLAAELPRAHVLHRPLDEALAARALDAYLARMDGERMYFLASDIERFQARRKTMADNLRAGDVSLAFEIFAVWRERATNRCDHVRALVAQGVPLDRRETFARRRDDASWPRDEAEWDELWRLRVADEIVARTVRDRFGAERGAAAPAPGERMARGCEVFREAIARIAAAQILGMYLESFCLACDPHCRFRLPADAAGPGDAPGRPSAGIGVETAVEDGLLVIESLDPGGPAARDARDIALVPGDRILAVREADGTEVDLAFGMLLPHAAECLLGAPGSRVELTVLPAGRVGMADARRVDLVRGAARAEGAPLTSERLSVAGPAGAPVPLASIRLPVFYSPSLPGVGGVAGGSAADDVAAALRRAREDGVAGVILDLRGNGGGSMVEAVRIAGLFLPGGPVQQVRVGPRDVKVVNDEDPAVAYAGPLVVLVDRRSASGSEMVAGTLQDYGRAVVVGDSRTHGKGTMQMPHPLGARAERGLIDATKAQCHRVTGATVQLTGVASDIVVPSLLDAGPETGEDRMPNALRWPGNPPPQTITPWSDLQAAVGTLRERSLRRRAADPRWTAYADAIATLGGIRKSGTVSLNVEERLAEATTIRAAADRMRGRDGGPAPPGTEPRAAWDPVREEAAHVLVDMIGAGVGGAVSPGGTGTTGTSRPAPVPPFVTRPPSFRPGTPLRR